MKKKSSVIEGRFSSASSFGGRVKAYVDNPTFVFDFMGHLYGAFTIGNYHDFLKDVGFIAGVDVRNYQALKRWVNENRDLCVTLNKAEKSDWFEAGVQYFTLSSLLAKLNGRDCITSKMLKDRGWLDEGSIRSGVIYGNALLRNPKSNLEGCLHHLNNSFGFIYMNGLDLSRHEDYNAFRKHEHYGWYDPHQLVWGLLDG